MRIDKNYWYLIFAILVLGIVGCANNKIEAQVHVINDGGKSTVSSRIEEQETIVNTIDDNIYSNIVNQYADVIDNDFYQNVLSNKSEDWDLIGKEVNINLLSNARDYKQYNVYYTLKDIDSNGVPELFIGGSDGNGSPLIYDIFIFDGFKIVNPFTELGYEFGYRTHLDFYTDGVFEVAWSNSGVNNGMDFYKISEEGHGIKQLDCISLNKAPNESLKYYHDPIGDTEISEEEFKSILLQFREAGKAELPWIEINQDNKS